MASVDVCTIIAKNYAPQARVLARSLQALHPDVRFHVLVIDETEGYLSEAEEPFALVDPHSIGLPDFERMAGIYDLLELSTAVKPWLLRTLLDRPDSDGVVYLDPDMRVYAPLDEMFTAVREHGLVLCPHNVDPMPRDGKRPSEQDILIAGAYNLGFIGLAPGPSTDHLLEWWSERLETECIVDPSRGFFVDQRWIDLVPGMVTDFHLLRDRGFNVAYWNLPTREIGLDEEGLWWAGDVPLRLFHFSGFDAARPHILSKHQNRIELSSHPDLAELCRRYADELLDQGARETASWPYEYAQTASGAPLNRAIRELYRETVADDGFEHSLFDADGEDAFLARLNSPANVGGEFGVTRYLETLWTQRPDLQRAYPQLDNPDHAAGFLGWAREFGIGEVPEQLRPPKPAQDTKVSPPAPAPIARPPTFGVNVAGYLRAELGVGEIARQAIAALDHVRVPLLPVAVPAPGSRQGHTFASVPPPDRAFPVNLLCVNADMLPALVSELGPRFFAGRYSIGWWWWEVERFPERWMGSFDHLDEVWTGSAFVQAALAAVSPVPVVRVPVPVTLSGAPVADRAGLELPEGPLFLFVFDHHSVFERKNPLGLVDAFLRAFPEPGEATLVIKSINGEHHPGDRERLRLAVAGHEHVLVRDDYLTPEQKNHLVASCDAYVSLHRSEGFGMTMAEAMLLGKPVIATGYSGNTDFMTAENSLLVRHTMCPVGPGADPYPAEAQWAEPDIDHAAELMRLVVDDPDAAQALGQRAAMDIVRTNGLEAAALAMYARLAAVRGLLPDPGHDYLWAAGEHTKRTRELLDTGSRPPRGRLRRATGLARRTVLRLMRPYTVHAERVDRTIAVALSDLATELAQVRAATQRQIESEAAMLRELRGVETRLRAATAPQLVAAAARIDDLGAQLDDLRFVLRQQGVLGADGRSAPATGYVAAPEVPWSHEYTEAHRAFVSAELDDRELLQRFRNGAGLPEEFGVGYDERVVEFPWIAAHELGPSLLDAGSALNHRHVITRIRSRVQQLHVLTLAPEDEAFPELGVSYLYEDLRALPMQDGTYDSVVCISTLEHVGMDNERFGVEGDRAAADPQRESLRAVSELWRVLRPGGRLLLTVPVGRGERYAWVRSLRLDELDELVRACRAETVETAFFRHAGGWRRAARAEVADAGYRDHVTAGPPENRIVAAEAVACVALLKPAS